jgi:hypothetical protein
MGLHVDGDSSDDDGQYDDNDGVPCRGPVFLVASGAGRDRDNDAVASVRAAQSAPAAAAPATAGVSAVAPPLLPVQVGVDDDPLPPVFPIGSAAAAAAAASASRAARKGFATWQHVKGDEGPTIDGKKKTASRNITISTGLKKWDHGLTALAIASDFRSPSASFFNFFDDTLVALIFHCTKLRMKEKDCESSPLQLDEVYDCLALIIAMGLRFQPSLHSYWDTQYFGKGSVFVLC